MSNITLVGRCGLYCGACRIYRAERDSEAMQNELANRFSCSPEVVTCNGCGDLTEQCWGNGCKIVKCLRSKNIMYCYECTEYASGKCEKFEGLANGYAKHNVDLKENLKLIEEDRIDDFLSLSKERFSCKHCGQPTIVGSNKCHHCGNADNKEQ